jgi:hypothetical protein
MTAVVALTVRYLNESDTTTDSLINEYGAAPNNNNNSSSSSDADRIVLDPNDGLNINQNKSNYNTAEDNLETKQDYDPNFGFIGILYVLLLLCCCCMPLLFYLRIRCESCKGFFRSTSIGSTNDNDDDDNYRNSQDDAVPPTISSQQQQQRRISSTSVRFNNHRRRVRNQRSQLRNMFSTSSLPSRNRDILDSFPIPESYPDHSENGILRQKYLEERCGQFRQLMLPYKMVRVFILRVVIVVVSLLNFVENQ